MTGDSSQNGLTLIEVLVAMFLITLCVLGAVPMFVQAIEGNAVGADLGTVGALGVARMEQLVQLDYDQLVPGGGLGTNVTDYSDLTSPGYAVRWQIVDNVSLADTRTVSVRAIALGVTRGPRREITLTTLRGR